MKLRMVACAAMIAAALGATSASAQLQLQQQQQNVTFVADFVDSWQQRILNENLPVPDARTWGLRNGPLIASLSAERFALAQQATTLEELEMLLVSSPIANGTTFGALAANPPGNIALNAMLKRGNSLAKSDPGSDPAGYADLAFTMVNPCRIYDSRVVAGGAGPWINGVARTVKIGPYSAAGGGYATGPGAQGGAASGCGLDALIGTSLIQGVMVAVSTVSQTNNGYLTFWSASAADPSLSVVSTWYRFGFIQTAFVVFPTDSIGDVWSNGISRQANTEVIVDIVGYFAKPVSALACTSVSVFGAAVAWNPGTPAQVSFPACAAGYSMTGVSCGYNGSAPANVYLQEGNETFGYCQMFNNSGGALSASSIRASTRCCRMPGR